MDIISLNNVLEVYELERDIYDGDYQIEANKALFASFKLSDLEDEVLEVHVLH